MDHLNESIGSGLGYGPLVVLGLLVALVGAYSYLPKNTKRSVSGWIKAAAGILILLTVVFVVIDALRLLAR